MCVLKLTGRGMNVTFSGDKCNVYHNGNFAFSRKKAGGTYKVKRNVVLCTTEQASKAQETEAAGWHWGAAHWHCNTFTMMAWTNVVRGFPSLLLQVDNCERCILGKFVRHSFKLSTNVPKLRIHDLLHMDLWGSFPSSLGGSRYVLILIHHHSHWRKSLPKWTMTKVNIHFLKYKGQVPSLICTVPPLSKLKVGRGYRQWRRIYSMSTSRFSPWTGYCASHTKWACWTPQTAHC